MTAPTGTPGAPTDGGTATGPAPAPGTQQPTPPASASGSGTQSQPASKTDLAQLPDDVKKYIDELRAESAKHRTDKQAATQAATDAQAQRDKILKALGLDGDGKEIVDPATLTEQIDRYKAIAWEGAVESHVVRLAASVGFDADTLLDSNQFLNSLEDLVELDPTGGDFKTKLEKHLKDFVGKHPKFKATPAGAPARSGGDMPPGNPGNPQARPTSLMAAVGQYMNKNRTG